MCFLSLGRVLKSGESALSVGCGCFVRRSFENESGVCSGMVANQTIDDSNVARLCKAPSLPTWGGRSCRGLAVHVKSRKTSDAPDRAGIVI